MEKNQYFRYLQEKLIDLKSQFLHEINNGRNLKLLRGLNRVIATVDKEIRLFHTEQIKKK